jgi:hypothetical protein
MMQVGAVADLEGDVLQAGFPLVKKMRILGTVLDEGCISFDDTFLEIVEKVQNQINIWSRFNLSLSGRINIAKTMMYSQLNYNGCFLPIDVCK